VFREKRAKPDSPPLGPIYVIESVWRCRDDDWIGVQLSKRSNHRIELGEQYGVSFRIVN